MYDIVINTTMIAALVVAVWCAVPIARDRWIGRGQLVGLAIVEAVLIVQAVLALVRLAGGARVTEMATFVGYLAASVVLVPLGVVLSFMERTRWGSIVAGSAALVVVILELRLRQVWRG